MGADTSRDKTIIKTSIIGVLVNVFLAAFKAGVGLMSNSIAIVMDAVNNLSDASSSVITIVGTKLAGREADRKHPFGYGRIEYLSAMVISILVLYAGITALVESIKKIVTPDVPDYSAVTLIVVAVAVVVKIFLGRYVKHVGKKVNSDSLVNSGEDATLDSVISASTLVAAGIYLFFNISLEAWLGAIIALVIIKSGLGMMAETLSKILGERADDKFAKAIKKTIASHPGVNGAYDPCSTTTDLIHTTVQFTSRFRIRWQLMSWISSRERSRWMFCMSITSSSRRSEYMLLTQRIPMRQLPGRKYMHWRRRIRMSFRRMDFILTRKRRRSVWMLSSALKQRSAARCRMTSKTG